MSVHLLRLGLLLAAASVTGVLYYVAEPLGYAFGVAGIVFVAVLSALALLIIRQIALIAGLVLGYGWSLGWLSGLVLTVVSVAVCLAAFEIALRMQEQRIPSRHHDVEPVTSGGGSVMLSMPEAWQMREASVPGARKAYYWHGKLHVYDDNMMRRVEPFAPKKNDVLRIVVLGDSLTYGQGVAEEDAYPKVLERNLSAKFRVEVLNLGVRGYNSTDVLATLLKFAPQLKPDLIVYGVCINDFIAKGASTQPGYPFPLPQWFKEFMVKNTRTGQFIQKEYDDLLVRLNLNPDFVDKILYRFPEYHRRFAEELKAMNSFSVANGYGPVMVMVVDQFPEPRRKSVAEIAEDCAEKAGMIVVRSEEFFQTYSGRGAELSVSRWDLHPNEKAHKIYAQSLQNAIEHLPLDARWQKNKD